ncbi:hypothetical protein NC651_018151 [Populus alba x Populus x berolinensis]|nr:hypothetical protein NC651_018151 [Populus alba x Populus x berolinensis]
MLRSWKKTNAEQHVNLCIIQQVSFVADGREVHLGLIYPCLMGARMLGSTLFPWLLSGPSSLRIEDCLVYAFTVLGLALSIVAYDYQVCMSLSLNLVRKRLLPENREFNNCGTRCSWAFHGIWFHAFVEALGKAAVSKLAQVIISKSSVGYQAPKLIWLWCPSSVFD